MKDLKFPVKGSLDPLPPLTNNEQLQEFTASIDRINSDIEMINLRLYSLEYHLLIGDYLSEEDKNLQELWDREKS